MTILGISLFWSIPPRPLYKSAFSYPFPLLSLFLTLLFHLTSVLLEVSAKLTLSILGMVMIYHCQNEVVITLFLTQDLSLKDLSFSPTHVLWKLWYRQQKISRLTLYSPDTGQWCNEATSSFFWSILSCSSHLKFVSAIRCIMSLTRSAEILPSIPFYFWRWNIITFHHGAPIKVWLSNCGTGRLELTTFQLKRQKADHSTSTVGHEGNAGNILGQTYHWSD